MNVAWAGAANATAARAIEIASARRDRRKTSTALAVRSDTPVEGLAPAPVSSRELVEPEEFTFGHAELAGVPVVGALRTREGLPVRVHLIRGRMGECGSAAAIRRERDEIELLDAGVPAADDQSRAVGRPLRI